MASNSLLTLYGLYSLAVVIPFLAAGARRLHDMGQSGWWQLIVFVPFGGIVLLVFWVQPSGADNEYGPRPA